MKKYIIYFICIATLDATLTPTTAQAYHHGHYGRGGYGRGGYGYYGRGEVGESFAAGLAGAAIGSAIAPAYGYEEPYYNEEPYYEEPYYNEQPYYGGGYGSYEGQERGRGRTERGRGAQSRGRQGGQGARGQSSSKQSSSKGEKTGKR